MYAMTNNHPVISKIISIVFFSIMGWLALTVAIEHGLSKLALILLYAVGLLSFFATYLLIVWTGYRSAKILLFGNLTQVNKWHLVSASVSPFAIVPMIALISGALLLHFFGGVLDARRTMLGVLLVIPVISLLIGAVGAILLGILKKDR